MSLFKKWKSISRTKKILGGVVLGVILGIIFQEKILVIDIIGSLFLRLMMMAAIPMIIVNLIYGVASLGDVKSFGRMGIKILLYYTATTLFACFAGIMLSKWINPVSSSMAAAGSQYEGVISDLPGFSDIVLSFVPSNIFAALSNGELQKVVMFCAFAGIAVMMLDTKDRERVTDIVALLSRMMNKVIEVVLIFAPYGICALVACAIGRYGKEMFGFAAKYIAVNYIGYAFMMVFYFLLLFLFTGKKAPSLYKRAFPGFLMAFSTSSSLATIPTNMECAEDMGIPREIYSFSVPLGAQINKDGTSIIFAANLVFAASLAGIELSTSTIITAMFMILMLTAGQSGLPASGSSSTVIMLNALNVPLDMTGIFSSLTPVVDMGNTGVNCLGDLIGSAIVAETEKRHEAKKSGSK